MPNIGFIGIGTVDFLMVSNLIKHSPSVCFFDPYTNISVKTFLNNIFKILNVTF